MTVERRGDRLVLGGWTSSPPQRKLLDRIIAGRTDVLDLTTDDTGDPHRLLEVDAIIFMVLGLDSQSVGHNFLRNVQVNASARRWGAWRRGAGFTPPPSLTRSTSRTRRSSGWRSSPGRT